MLALPVLLVLLVKFVDPPVWSWQIQRWISPPAGYLENTQHNWVALDDIAKPMQLAVIASEDQLFTQHWGVDVQAIRQALADNSNGKRLRGGSTITQQAAKNLFLWPDKSYFRKAVELGFAVLLDLICGKQRTLELYLNIVEFGPGIYGVEAASQHFFARSAAELSQYQAALLASALPNPYKYDVARSSRYMQKRVRWIRQQMRQLGMTTLQQL